MIDQQYLWLDFFYQAEFFPDYKIGITYYFDFFYLYQSIIECFR